MQFETIFKHVVKQFEAYDSLCEPNDVFKSQKLNRKIEVFLFIIVILKTID